MAGKQAKIFSGREILQVLNHLKATRYPLRDEVMFLLSIKAGLRAKEISLPIRLRYNEFMSRFNRWVPPCRVTSGFARTQALRAGIAYRGVTIPRAEKILQTVRIAPQPDRQENFVHGA